MYKTDVKFLQYYEILFLREYFDQHILFNS